MVREFKSKEYFGTSEKENLVRNEIPSLEGASARKALNENFIRRQF